MEYKFEKLTDDNIVDLLPIYKSAFDIDIDLNELKAKFNTSSFGFKNVGFIAYSLANEPAAFYGVFPCEIEINGEKKLIAQSGDTMTHRKHRRKKLFVLLAEKTFEYCKENGFHLIYGFPNELSYMSFVKKLNWSHDESIRAYHIRCKCLPFIRLKEKLPFLTNALNNFKSKRLEGLQTVGRTFESIGANSGEVGVLRDQKFIEYKSYFKKYFIEIEGVLVWVKPKDMFLLVGDIEKCSDETFQKIIKRLQKICFAIGIPHLRFHTSPNSNIERLLIPISKKHEIEYPIGYLKLSDSIEPSAIQYSLADYHTF